MKTNICNLIARVGKCTINIKSQGSFAVALQLGSNQSPISSLKKIRNDSIHFNTTLRLTCDRDQLQHQKCRVLLHFIRENRERQIVGVASFNPIEEHNKGFKYHTFSQCANSQACIELSITYDDFQYVVKSQIYATGPRFARDMPQQGQQLNHSRGRESIGGDSILDRDYELLKRSKAQSNIVYSGYQGDPKCSFSRIRDPFPHVRKKRQQNLSQCTPDQIITHYQSELKQLQGALREKEEWASGMRFLVKQLQAENQLLKQITVEDLTQHEIKNMQEGIQAVSKLIHHKLQASKSRQASSRILQVQEDQEKIQKHDNQGSNIQPRNSLSATRSLSNLPKLGNNQAEVTQNEEKHMISSKEDLEKALNLLSKECEDAVQTQRDSGMDTEIIPDRTKDSQKIRQSGTNFSQEVAELQEELFKTRQEKNELFDISNQIYSELKYVKQQRDAYKQQREAYKNQIIDFQRRYQDLYDYVQAVKEENRRLKLKLEELERKLDQQAVKGWEEENMKLQQKLKDLERQRQESIRAIKQLTNDVLTAREELITKEEEISSLNQKLVQRQINSSKQGLRQNNYKVERVNKNLFVQQQQSNEKTKNQHFLYSQLLKNSIQERKNLQKSLAQMIKSKKSSKQIDKGQIRQNKSRKLQERINQIFLLILKNRESVGNIAQIEKGKRDICNMLEQIVSCY